MAAASTWKLDPAHTTVELSVKHMMFTTVRGRLTRLSGTIHLNPDNPDASDVEVELDAASIDTGVTDRDTHLRSADFLDVERYPKITFRSTRVEGATRQPGDRFRVIGDLTIKDVTREITLDATYEGTGKDPWGGQRAGFAAGTRIDRREWGLTWNQPLETGGILVGNTLDLDIQAQAVRAEQVGDERAAA